MQSPDLSGMVITAALSMTRMGIDGPQFIDQELAMPSMLGSNKLQAVTDESDGPPLVALTSLSENSQQISIHCLSEIGSPFMKNIELSPNETLLTSACSERTVHGADIQDFDHNFNPKSRNTYGITVSSDAMPGSFAAFGLAPHSDRDTT